MQPPHQQSRINLVELKAQIVKKLGPEGSKQYFYYLNRFLSLKLSKAEFNKLCVRIVGRDNITLHNQFIRSILRNACNAKAPPPAQVSSKDVSADGCLQNGSHMGTTQACGSPGLSNGGDILPVSPRKARTTIRKTGVRLSALGPNGKTSFVPQHSTATQSSDLNVLENGDLQHHQGLIQQVENENNLSALRRLPDDEAFARSPLRAPLGVPFCPVSIGGARRSLLPASSRYMGTSDNGALLDSVTLREQMANIALAQGLEGVSIDCANMLNHGLDSYLKGLIRSCIQLVGARSVHELTNNNNNPKQLSQKLINGVRPGYLYQMQNNVKPLEAHEQRISLQDFRVAMELNPRQLGEDWPLLLEKICTHAFEE